MRSDPDRRCVDRDSYDYPNGYEVVADENRKSGSSGSSYGKGGKKKGASKAVGDAD